MCVPAALPSVTQSSVPCVPSFAAKNTLPSAALNLPLENPLAGPGLTSSTRLVPRSVPSLAHSSVPCAASVATKSTFAPNAMMPSGLELPEPGTMSLTSTVPTAVPSLFQSSSPAAVVVSSKKTIPLVVTAKPVPGAIDELSLNALTLAVPGEVPSVFQKRDPCPSTPVRKNAEVPPGPTVTSDGNSSTPSKVWTVDTVAPSVA